MKFNILNSELSFLTRMFLLFLTRGFMALSCAFDFSAVAFNHATCSFSFLTRTFELVTRRYELITQLIAGVLLFHLLKSPLWE